MFVLYKRHVGDRIKSIPSWGHLCLLLTNDSSPSCCRDVEMSADVSLLVVGGWGCEGGGL
jgi:hypothetical protein